MNLFVYLSEKKGQNSILIIHDVVDGIYSSECWKLVRQTNLLKNQENMLSIIYSYKD